MEARQNPPTPSWAQKVLVANWSALERLVGGGALPSAVQGKRGKIQLSEPALGCGYFGCVLSVADGGDTVLKITSDVAEGTFVATYLEEPEERRPLGIIRYSRVIKLPGEYLKRPIFAIWRESADDVGRVFREFSGLGGDDHYEKGLKREATQRLSSFKVAGELLRKNITGRKNPKQAAENIVRLVESRWGDFEVDVEKMGKEAVRHQEYVQTEVVLARRRWGKGDLFGAWCLKALYNIAEMIGSEAGATLIGEALLHYLERNIVLADVHLNNVGLAIREDYAESVPVITDPGHMIAMPGSVVFSPNELGTAPTS